MGGILLPSVVQVILVYMHEKQKKVVTAFFAVVYVVLCVCVGNHEDDVW